MLGIVISGHCLLGENVKLSSGLNLARLGLQVLRNYV